MLSRSLHTVILLALVGLGIVAMSVTLQAQDRKEVLNDIRFPKENWDPNFLALIEQGPYFLPRGEAIVVPPPFANDSEETKTELEILRKYQAERRTPEEIARINAENTGDLNFENMPRSEKIDMAVGLAVRELNFFIMKWKKEYNRARPTQLAPDLTTLVAIPGHAAYPSGHATQARMVALVLGYIDEKNKAAYESYAHEVAVRREIAGLHYPSDSIAGEKLADAVFEKLLQKPEYKQVLDAAKQDFMSQTN